MYIKNRYEGKVIYTTSYPELWRILKVNKVSSYPLNFPFFVCPLILRYSYPLVRTAGTFHHFTWILMNSRFVGSLMSFPIYTYRVYTHYLLRSFTSVLFLIQYVSYVHQLLSVLFTEWSLFHSFLLHIFTNLDHFYNIIESFSYIYMCINGIIR